MFLSEAGYAPMGSTSLYKERLFFSASRNACNCFGTRLFIRARAFLRWKGDDYSTCSSAMGAFDGSVALFWLPTACALNEALVCYCQLTLVIVHL
eukprot:m.263236 g.263236  ORF g.263236 m.263236 type:complete len:95 (-) comp15601_c1_seq1:31-315(-)